MTISTNVFIRTGQGETASLLRKEMAAFSNEVGQPFDPSIFNYDENRKPINGYPMIRWGSNSQGVSLTGLGVEGSRIVLNSAVQLSRLISQKRDGSVYPIEFEEVPVNFVLNEKDNNAVYRAYRPVVYIHRKKQQRFVRMSENDKRKELKRIILRDLQKQVRFLGIDMPLLSLTVLDYGEELMVKTHKTPSGKQIYGYALKYIDFMLTTYRMTGRWAVGHSLNLGYGQLRHTNRAQVKAALSPDQLFDLVEGL